jgi:hypothetical protein
MTTAEIYQALIKHLVTMASAPNIVVPEGEGASLPRLVVLEAGAIRQPVRLAGNHRRVVEIAIRIETQTGALANQANDMLDQIEARFAVGTTFDGVTILTPPAVRPSFRDEAGVYVTPVFIQGTAEA